MIENILVAIGQLLVVGLPSWVTLLFTVDAPLVPGADVFLITLAQVLFLVVFIPVAREDPGHLWCRATGDRTGGD